MPGSRSPQSRLPAVLSLVFGCLAVSCSNHDTTTAPGTLATVTVDAPESATSGQSFSVTVAATAVGISGVHNGHVSVMVPAPLAVTAEFAPPGSSASFTSGSATWSLGTLDSNSSVALRLTVMGTLPPGSMGQLTTITASLTGDGLHAGDAVASDSVQVNP